MEGVDARPSSGLAWPAAGPSATIPNQNQNMVGLTASSLDVLQQQLLQPTPAQEQEQVFGLTPDQYNNVVAPHSYYQGELGPSPSHTPTGPTMSKGRRELAAMRDRQRGGKNAESAAEVYTRSLLWDKVPAEVVREFARFVMANGGGETSSGSGASTVSGDTAVAAAMDGGQQQQQQQQRPKMEVLTG